MMNRNLLAAAALAMMAVPALAQTGAQAVLVDKVADPMITVTAHALSAQRYALAAMNEAHTAQLAGHKGAAAVAAHHAAAAHFRAAAQEHDAAARLAAG